MHYQRHPTMLFGFFLVTPNRVTLLPILVAFVPHSGKAWKRRVRIGNGGLRETARTGRVRGRAEACSQARRGDGVGSIEGAVGLGQRGGSSAFGNGSRDTYRLSGRGVRTRQCHRRQAALGDARPQARVRVNRGRPSHAPRHGSCRNSGAPGDSASLQPASTEYPVHWKEAPPGGPLPLHQFLAAVSARHRKSNRRKGRPAQDATESPRSHSRYRPTVGHRGRSQRNQNTFDPVPDISLEIRGRHQIHRRADDLLELGLQTSQSKQPQPLRKICEQVDIAVVAILAAGHAAEHPKMDHAMTRRGVDQLLPVQAHTPADRPAESVQAPRRPPKPHVHLEPGRLNEGRQCRQRRFSVS